MKKMILVFCMIFFVATITIGCSNSNNTQSKTNNNQGEEATTESKEKNIKFSDAEFGKKIELDFAEITFDKLLVTSELVYAFKDGSTMGPTLPGDNNEFVGVRGRIKNTSAESYIPIFYGEIIFDEKYSYKLETLTIVDDSDWLYGDELGDNQVNPFQEGTFEYTTEVPKELLETYKTCEIRIGFSDSFANENADFSTCNYSYKLVNDSVIEQKDVKLGDTVNADGLEITLGNIQYADLITQNSGENVNSPSSISGTVPADNNVFVIYEVNVKNNNDYTVNCYHDLITSLVYNDITYGHDNIWECRATDGGDDLFIEPGKERYFRCYFECPEDVEEKNGKEEKLILNVNGSTYTYNID